jgi:thiamine biosynthesis lipoprotein
VFLFTPSAAFAGLIVAVALHGCDAPDDPKEPTRAPVVSASVRPAPPPPPTRISMSETAMGTHVLLAAYTDAGLDADAVRAKLGKGFAEFKRIEDLMTTWRDSEVTRINAAAGVEAVTVGPDTLAVVDKSLWASRSSEGVFDISFEAMHGIWKFDQDLEPKVPGKDAIEAARKLIDYRKIKVDDAKSTVMLEQKGMRVSLGGIAKGYGVDAVARVLVAEGLRAFFVQAGGDLFVKGRKPDGAAFRVGTRDPRGEGPDDFFAMLEVEDHAFSTAGDYERSFVKDGRRYHHILDPRTGYPATASRSVTIWAKDALTADAIDDAVFILGPKKGLALVESIDDCGAVIVDTANKVWISARLAGKVQVLKQPTDGI